MVRSRPPTAPLLGRPTGGGSRPPTPTLPGFVALGLAVLAGLWWAPDPAGGGGGPSASGVDTARSAAAEASRTPTASTGQETSLALDTASLADGPHARMHALLERTIFQVDVLTLDLRVGTRTAAALERLASGHRYSDDRADSVAAVMLGAGDVFTRIRFRRGVELEQLLDGIRENLRTARRAGLVGEEVMREVADSLSIWYRPLADRGIREGDAMMYRIRGDSLRVVFRGVDGRILLDQRRVGRSHTLSVLAGYFAPGAELREGLVRSLFAREE